MKKVTMLNDLRDRCGSFAAMGFNQKLDVLIESAWLLIILLMPVYFNPLCYNVYNFAKASALVFLVSLLLGLVLAQWLLVSPSVRLGDLPAKIQKSPLQFAALVLGLMWSVSTAFSVMPGRSLWVDLAGSVGLLPNLAWIIFFLVIAHKVKRRTQVYRALYTLLISSGIVALAGILQFSYPNILPWNSARISSTDGNPLSLSCFMAMAMPVTLALVILNWYGWGSQPRSKAGFTMLLGLFGLQMWCLALAQYSITLLLFIIGIFIFFALTGVFLQRKATLALSVLTILLLVVLAGVLIGQLMLTENKEPSIETQSPAAPVAEQVGLPTLGIRVQNWVCALDVIIDSPEIPFNNDSLHFLRRFIGYGPETFVATSQLKFPVSLKSSYTSQAILIAQPENHYLYLGVTLGILGLLAFLWLLAVFFHMGLHLLARSANKETIILVAAFGGAIAQYCAHIFFNPSRAAPELVFWLVLGLTVALVKIDSKDRTDFIAGVPATNNSTGTATGTGNLRKLMSISILIIFIAIGSGLTVPMTVANMKIRSGFNQWDKDPSRALASFTEAILIGPEQSNYHDFLGNLAFSTANQANTDHQDKDTLITLSELAGNAAIQLEPQLAVWRYRLADREMYRIIDGSAGEKANILYLYKEADQLFPGNAVILNKWALALILTEDYGEAEQKLVESSECDAAWVPTFYLKGLLKMHQGYSGGAGGLFVSPVENNPDSIIYFISFCGQAANFREIGLVRDALAMYVASHRDSWTGYALLGITDIYNRSIDEARADFKDAALLVPDEHAALLASVVEVLLGPK